jgi:dienelactone hydrolase
MALAVAASSALAAPDYAREDRWAAEVAPTTVVGEVVYLSTASRPRVLALWTEATAAKGGVVLVHGQGVHPDWGLIGGLRMRLADAGLSTLSVQMPLLSSDAPRDAYSALQPQANERIDAAIAYARSHGVRRVAIVAHSMGASMVNAYLGSAGAARIDAFVPIGMWGDFAIAPREPVLDVIAADDFAQVLESAPRRAPVLPRDGCSQRVIIAGTDHYMANRHAELASALLPFLQRAFDGGCR